MLIALVLICACSATTKVKAQSTCATAVSFTPTAYYNATTYNIADSLYWLKFVAPDSTIFLKVVSPNQTPKATITHIYLYSGACAALTLLQRKGNSDSLAIHQGSLTIGNTYYVKVNRTATTSAYFALAYNYGPIIVHGYADNCHGTICDTIMNYFPNIHYDYHFGDTNPNAPFTHLSISPIAGTSMAVFCVPASAGELVLADYQLFTPNDSFNVQRDTFRISACCNAATIEFNDITVTTDDTLKGTYVVNGTVILNANIVLGGTTGGIFHSATLFMGPYAQIFVCPGKTLTIDSSIVQAGCDVMWNCIYLTNNTSNLIVKRHSTIRDGINAIVSKNGGVFNINASTLTENYKNIVVHYYNNNHSGRITKSLINCTGVLDAPYHSQGTYLGIEADSVKKLFVGDSTTSVQNHFDIPNFGTVEHTTYGIFGNDSYIYAYNNLFSNFGTNYAYTTQVGLPYCGIYTKAINANVLLPLSALRVGYSAAVGYFKRNTFHNCEYGIQTTDSKFTSIYDNTFLYDHLGTTSYNNWGDAIFNYFVNSSPAITSILKNNFTTYAEAVFVWNNQATNIQCNNITIANDPGTDPSFQLFGIAADYCPYAVISSNPVTGSSSTDVNMSGLHVESGYGTTMGCNSSGTVGNAIMFGGNCTPNTVIYKNGMSAYHVGLYLNSALIGTQGAATNPNGNTWMTAGTRNDTWAVGINGNTSPFFVGAIGTMYYPAINGSSGVLPLVPTATAYSTTLTCTSCSSIGPADMDQGELIAGTANSELMDIAQGTSLTSLTDENKWLTKYFAYNDILLNNIPTTGALTSFMQTNQSSDIGLLTQVNSLIESGNYAQAIMTVGNITTTSSMAANLKSFFTLYVGNLAAGSKYILSTAQNATLITMAQQCPYTYGPAVYHARAYLRACGDMTTYQNTCEVLPTPANAKLVNPNNIQQDIPISIYPNPAKDKLNVLATLPLGASGEINIYDAIGNKVLTLSLTEGENNMEVNLSNIAAGVYFYKVKVENQTVKSDKLIIIK